jgi:ABC-type transport system involved in cytochrome bd biosynthesis fused ATPase/permease subunit
VIYIAAAALLFASGWLIDRCARFGRSETNKRLEAGYRPLASGSSPALNELKS